MSASPNIALTFSNIIIWRHAQAADAVYGDDGTQNDLTRPLTQKGQLQAKRMAGWLKRRLPQNTFVLSSDALRAFQTAQALDRKVNVHAALNPTAYLQEIMSCLVSLNAHKNILLVGHQPCLGQLIAHLIGLPGNLIDIKKGAIWWLRLGVNPSNFNQPLHYQVVSVLTPRLL